MADSALLEQVRPTHLKQLEAESIHIIREVAAEFENPVMLYSIGKDSACMLHLALKAFHPGKPPFPLLHVDTHVEVPRDDRVPRSVRRRRTRAGAARAHQPGGGRGGDQPVRRTGAKSYTDIMKTEALKQALEQYGFDAAFGGARRDEEKSRAKERVFSFRDTQPSLGSEEPAARAVEPVQHAGPPRREHSRVSAVATGPSSTCGSTSIWSRSPSCRCTSAAERPVVERDGSADHGRRRPVAASSRAKNPRLRRVRFRTLGCYPLSGAVDSNATTLPEIIQEMLLTTTSERQGRVIDSDEAGSMEKKKREGYF